MFGGWSQRAILVGWFLDVIDGEWWWWVRVMAVIYDWRRWQSQRWTRLECPICSTPLVQFRVVQYWLQSMYSKSEVSMFTHYKYLTQYRRVTDTQTQDDSIYRATIASCGKNHMINTGHTYINQWINKLEMRGKTSRIARSAPQCCPLASSHET